MYVGYSAGVLCRVPESIAEYAGASSDENEQEAEDGSEYIVYDMYHCRASLNRLGAYAADKVSCEAVSDVDTDDDREHRAKCHAHRARYRLYDTYDGG